LKFDGWIPIRFYWRDGQPEIDWCLLGDTRFTEPFFQMTVQRRLRHPFHHAFRRQTSIDALQEWYAERPGVPPTAFIFHMSRCGSTLLSQMLAALDQNIVLSEASPLDALLRAHLRNPGLPPQTRAEWFRYMVSALGQRRGGKEEFLFIKFDCWSLAEMPVIREAFPDVPWIFLFREPVDVLLSHLHRPAAWTLDTEMAEMPRQEYCARKLGRICELALLHYSQAGGLLLNYAELPAAACSTLPDYLGIRYGESDLSRMREVALYDSHTPGLRFEAIRRNSSGEIRELSARWIDPFYRRLETARIQSLQAV
jgi:hypothetical protein